jgi:hypothetical protein
MVVSSKALMDKQTLRWGVLSTAKIGVEKVIPAMQRGELTEITAIASRSPEPGRMLVLVGCHILRPDHRSPITARTDR